ncbi:MAG: methyltransferase domain-containing protein [Polyangiaceae bacterium]
MQDRERWDARHAAEPLDRPRPPDAWVREVVEGLASTPRSALDLACGTGRHALWLAQRGTSVEAWDVSPVGLRRLRQQAQERGLVIETREVDLSGPLPTPLPRDLVLVVDYLDRELLDRLAPWITPGGHALVSTFTDDYPGPHPSARFRLRRGELRALQGLETRIAQERGGRALLLATRA